MSQTQEPELENRPEPVVDAQKVTAAILGVVGGVLTLLAAFGVTVEDDTRQAVVGILTGLFTLISIALPLMQAKKAREKVTPLSDPRNKFGDALVPAPDSGRRAPQ